MTRSESILKSNGLRKTEFRIRILDILLKQDHKAVSSLKIEKDLSDFDRVTLYRTLKSFEDKDIIHKVMTDTQEVRFALCDNHCEIHTHSKTHAHFNCNKCHETYCLEEPGEVKIGLPENYKVDQTQLILSGVCANCD